MVSNDAGRKSSETNARHVPPAYDVVLPDFNTVFETAEATTGPKSMATDGIASNFESDAQREPLARDVLIAVMGPTGSGKSTFINLATQSDKLKVGHDVTSCTDTVDVGDPFELDGRRVFLLDTPGFDDTNKSQLEILRIIASELEIQFREGVKLHGIIYVHRISDKRVSGVTKSNFGIFRKICGDDSLKNVIITTTMWSEVSEAKGQQRVHQLESLDDFFKPALEKKARMMHHKDDTVQSAHNIIRQILNNHPLSLALQRELVDDNKPIEETMASLEVDRNIAALRADYEKQKRELQAAMEQAIREKDEETRQELAEEAAKKQAQIDQLKADQKSHAAKYDQLRDQLYEEQKRAEEEWKAQYQRAEEEWMEKQRAEKREWDARQQSDREEWTTRHQKEKEEWMAERRREEYVPSWSLFGLTFYRKRG